MMTLRLMFTGVRAAISSTLPVPSSVAGVGRASGAMRATTTLQTDGGGQSDRFGQPRLRIAQGAHRRRDLGLDMNDEGGAHGTDCLLTLRQCQADSCVASS